MKLFFRFVTLVAVLAMSLAEVAPAWALTSRIKDIASLQAGRDNQLIGYGLIVGLQGTGDGFRSSPFTEQSMRAMLQNLGISTQGGQSNAKNTAAVMVTANLPPFASPGSRIDVTVSSLGDATSLRGGTLVMTSLSGADGQIYAVAQGAAIVSGFQAQGQAATVTEGVTTAGRVPGGAIIERELPSRFEDSVNLVLQLRNPDFSTAIRIADIVNGYASARFGGP
ncbi:MAG: flagellar basal body P-ring protein FlgI, partial [Rhizobium sp.]|uniref:flagellar basal body P-ring protein FlgI n=1 Tax=Rhizobium sp. TaxID=391 RepID=UPI003899D8A3